jgi:hypothetical protein
LSLHPHFVDRYLAGYLQGDDLPRGFTMEHVGNLPPSA